MGVEFIGNPNEPEYVDEDDIQTDEMSLIYFNMDEEGEEEEESGDDDAEDDYSVITERVRRAPRYAAENEQAEEEEEDDEDCFDDDDDDFNPSEELFSSDMSDVSEIQQYAMSDEEREVPVPEEEEDEEETSTQKFALPSQEDATDCEAAR